MVLSGSVDVGTTPTIIAQNTETSKARERASYTFSTLMKNTTATATVFLGKGDVATGTGYPWAVADGQLTVDLAPGETLYGIVAAGTQTVKTLRAG